MPMTQGFIDDITSEFKDLMEQNNKLKEENKKLSEQVDVLIHSRNQAQVIINKLTEENYELKENVNGDGWMKQGYKTELINKDKQMNRMVREIVKLKEEIEGLHQELRDVRKLELNHLDTIKKLKEQK